MSSIQIPQFSLPFRIINGQAAVNEQDSDAEIRDCVLAICLTPIGTRIELPDFGVPDTTFTQGGADATLIEAAVQEWEPRAAAAAAADNTSLEDFISQVTVQVNGGTT